MHQIVLIVLYNVLIYHVNEYSLQSIYLQCLLSAHTHMISDILATGQLQHRQHSVQSHTKFPSSVFMAAHSTIPRGVHTMYVPCMDEEAQALLDEYENSQIQTLLTT